MIALELTGKSLSAIKRELMKPTRRPRVSLVIGTGMNVQSPHKRWSTLKSTVFGSSSSLPPLVSEGIGLVCE